VQQNTARMLEKVEIYIGRIQNLGPVWHGSNSAWSSSAPKLQLELALGGVGAGWLVCLAWRVPSAPEKRVVKVDCRFCP